MTLYFITSTLQGIIIYNYVTMTLEAKIKSKTFYTAAAQEDIGINQILCKS